MPHELKSVRDLFELKSRNYLVTGGAVGFGFAVTHAICQMGGNVAVLDSLEEPAQEFAALNAKFGVKTTYIKTNFTVEDSLNAGFEQALAFLGSIDGCVPCAEINIDKPFLDQTWQEMTDIQELNTRAVFFTAQLVARQIKKQGSGGSIVLVASQCAHVAIPGYRMAAYNASKGAVKMLAVALGVELAPFKIRVNTISPGFIESDMLEHARSLKSVIEGAQMREGPPLKRIGTYDDVSGMIIYLLSDASAYATAADFLVTGGIHAGRIDVE